jgi:hypothetical protein
MAYLRWSYSPWYVFWHSDSDHSSRGGQRLAVWRDRDHLELLTYDEVVAFLLASDPVRNWDRWGGAPPGPHRDELVDAMQLWITEVEAEYPS